MGGCGSKDGADAAQPNAPKQKKKKENWDIQVVRHDLKDDDIDLSDPAAFTRKGINCMSLNEDQSMIATGADDGSVKVWSTKTERCECLANLVGHEDYVNAVLFEGFFVVSASADKTIRKWDISNGECILEYISHTSIINRLICTGDLLFSSSYDKTIRCWDFDSGDCLKTFVGHKRGVYPLIFIPDFIPAVEDEDDAAANRNFPTHGNRDLLISGSADMTARLWSYENGKTVCVYTGHKGAITCMTVDGNAKILFTGSTDNTLRSWNVIKGEQLKVFEGHQGSIVGISFRNKILYSASADATGRSWVTEFAECTRIYKEHKHSVTAIKVVDGLVYTGSGDSVARIFDGKSGALKRSFEGHIRPINCLQIVKCEVEEPEDELDDPPPNCIDDRGVGRAVEVKLFTGSYDGTIRVWDAGGIKDETVFSKDAEEQAKKEKEKAKAKKKKQKELEKQKKKAAKTNANGVIVSDPPRTANGGVTDGSFSPAEKNNLENEYIENGYGSQNYADESHYQDEYGHNYNNYDNHYGNYDENPNNNNNYHNYDANYQAQNYGHQERYY